MLLLLLLWITDLAIFLSLPLSRYAHFIFLSYHRFETSKKGVSKIPYKDLADSAALLMVRMAVSLAFCFISAPR